MLISLGLDYDIRDYEEKERQKRAEIATKEQERIDAVNDLDAARQAAQAAGAGD